MTPQDKTEILKTLRITPAMAADYWTTFGGLRKSYFWQAEGTYEQSRKGS